MTASHESVAEPRPQIRMPDFFTIGHAKCGTTALYEMLRAHRDICYRFQPEVEKLSKYVGRDSITLWGYDRVA